MDIAEIRKKAKQMEAAKEAALKDLAPKEDAVPEVLPRAVSVDEASLDIVSPPPRPSAPDDDFIIDDTPEALEKVAEAAPKVEAVSFDDSADFIIDDTVPEAQPEGSEDYLIDDTPEAASTKPLAAAPSEVMEDYIIDDTPAAGEAAAVTAPMPEEVSEAAPVESEEAAGEDLEAITFMIGREIYAIDILEIREIIKTKDLTDVPRAPDVIFGVLSLRGTVVPVMDLPTALSIKGYVQPSFMDEAGISRERIIIVKDGEELMGFKVDAIEGVVRVPRKTLEPPPMVDSLDTETIQAIGRCDGRPFILIAVDKVLSRV
ncbi:MAG: chemotaxis protein CheW [Deltaproteobacteria bacterium]|nr:chemotaxis protein CheW [Deltaproteobacteria bacterium]